MTKQEILEKFKDIDFMYNDSSKHNTLERMLDELLKEQQKEIKALRLLVEWAEECDFGFDNFPEEYERYKDEIKGMGYIDAMIHIAKRTIEDKRHSVT